MNKISLLILLIIFFYCKPPKEKELNDPEWRKESAEIAYNICTKLESCVQDEVSKIKEKLRAYTSSEIKAEKCSERNKKSRVYLLKGSDPLKIKQITRACYANIQKFSCEEIRSGSIKKDVSCEEMRRIQQGEIF